MRKKLVAALVSFMLVAVVFSGCKKTTTTPTDTDTTGAKFHIGIVSNSVSQSEDGYRGAQAFLEEYGDTANGGMVTQVAMPDNFSSEQETVISDIVGLADDPLMKAIVVCPAVGGTTEAFKQIREKRPDILLFANVIHEDPLVIAAASDQVIDLDNVAYGYFIPWAAHQMGAKTLVHISFPRHMSQELISRRAYIMQQTCKDLGMKFVFESAPDPLSDVGVAGAQQFMLEKTPAWIQKYGKDTAFFTSNDGLTEPLIKQIIKYGGIYVDSNMPSPVVGYAGALGLDLTTVKGDWPAILKKVEQGVIAAGGSGRMASGGFSFWYTNIAGCAEYAKHCIEGTAKLGNTEDIENAFNKYSSAGTWAANNYTDVGTGKTLPNFSLMYQNIYVFGKGYLQMMKQVIPEKYRTFKVPAS